MELGITMRFGEKLTIYDNIVTDREAATSQD